MIKVQDVSFAYPGSPARLQFPDFSCGQGSQLLITGESGSGKTTLLGILGGLIRQTSGTVEVAATDLLKLNNSQLDQFRGKHIGFVLQEHHFIESVSVLDNLKITARIAGNQTQPAELLELLDKLGIHSKAAESPSRLSVGERQRLGIARAMVNKPAVLLADEPTSSLDSKNFQVVTDLLQREAEAGNTTLVIVTHDERMKALIQQQVNL
ncbi:MAG: ATP-binding cassette domain-containing protein [Bacteroidota bacterium]